MPISTASSTPVELYACFTCREAKRKCDKISPSCSQCKVKNDYCVYPRRRKQRIVHNRAAGDKLTPPDETAFAHQSPKSLETSSHAASEFYLDPGLFRFEISTKLGPGLWIPDEITAAVGETASIHSTTKIFFNTVQRWLPIMRKASFYSTLSDHLSQRRAEIYLLILSMKLLASKPAETSSNIYLLVKQFHAHLETQGVLSLLVLQASILITTYEVGHGIYPAVYLSVSQAARYASVLGVDKSLYAHSCPPGMGLEECRRAWWSILVLDRFINLSDPSRSTVTPDPDLRSFLPLDDKEWEKDSYYSDSAYTVGNANSYELGSFARFAQTAHLLSQVLSQVANGSSDTEQLRKTIISLVNVSKIESHLRKLELCTQMAICYNCVLLLDFPDSILAPIKTPGEVVVSDETAEIIQAALKMSSVFTQEYVDAMCNFMSPFLPQLLYKLASVCMTLSSSSVPSPFQGSYPPLKQSLVWLSQRWNVSGMCVTLLERREAATQYLTATSN